MSGIGTGKVLKSDSNSKLFFYFADHGAPGLIAFPHEYLYADELNDALNAMYADNMYDEFLIYIEACESGSMFYGILDDSINIYATTAADEDESSWGTYCYPDDVVNGKHINSCLGDLYSVNWMEDTDASDMTTHTIGEQFTTVKAKTTKSHVSEFGDKSFKGSPIGMF